MAIAAVFDIDGTLVTFKFDVQGTRRALLEELSARGFSTDGLGLTSPTQTILESAEAQISSGRVAADLDEVRQKLYSILDSFELESVSSATVFPEALEVIERLKAKSVRLAVVSNSGRKAAAEALGRAGLQGAFEFVLTREDAGAMKPRPDGLARAVSILGLPPSRVVYVGDSPYDIAAAKAAGLRVVSIATGNYTAERLRKEGADHVILSMSELPGLLGA